MNILKTMVILLVLAGLGVAGVFIGIYVETDKDNTDENTNVCECSNGIPAKGSDCPVDGALKCSSCIPEYHVSNGTCIPNICNCPNGVLSDTCNVHGGESCSSCNNGYHLSNGKCIRNTCTCENGIAKSGSLCTEHGSESCKYCNGGYRLSDGKCNIIAVCKCTNGVLSDTCTVHGSESCKSCNNGYRLSDGKCISNTCVCPNGIAATGSSCTVNGATKCSSCNGVAHLSNGACVKNICSCTNGTVSQFCTSHGSQDCTSCNTGYYKNSTICSEICGSDIARVYAEAYYNRFGPNNYMIGIEKVVKVPGTNSCDIKFTYGVCKGVGDPKDNCQERDHRDPRPLDYTAIDYRRFTYDNEGNITAMGNYQSGTYAFDNDIEQPYQTILLWYKQPNSGGTSLANNPSCLIFNEDINLHAIPVEFEEGGTDNIICRTRIDSLVLSLKDLRDIASLWHDFNIIAIMDEEYNEYIEDHNYIVNKLTSFILYRLSQLLDRDYHNVLSNTDFNILFNDYFIYQNRKWILRDPGR